MAVALAASARPGAAEPGAATGLATPLEPLVRRLIEGQLPDELALVSVSHRRRSST
ncbi:MAG: hypothetical protein R2939_03175 [Kofleriaceae bacterium]